MKCLVSLHADVDAVGSAILELLGHKHSLVALWLLMAQENDIMSHQSKSLKHLLKDTKN